MNYDNCLSIELLRLYAGDAVEQLPKWVRTHLIICSHCAMEFSAEAGLTTHDRDLYAPRPGCPDDHELEVLLNQSEEEDGTVFRHVQLCTRCQRWAARYYQCEPFDLFLVIDLMRSGGAYCYEKLPQFALEGFHPRSQFITHVSRAVQNAMRALADDADDGDDADEDPLAYFDRRKT